MVSDTLSECAEEIRWYINKMPGVYASMMPRIDSLLTEMDNLRIELDTPPKAEIDK
jgi:hypothetical protein